MATKAAFKRVSGQDQLINDDDRSCRANGVYTAHPRVSKYSEEPPTIYRGTSI